MNSKQKQSKKQQLIEKFGCKCSWFQKALLPNQLTLDYLIPKSHKSFNSFENLRVVYVTCNNFCSNSLYPSEFKQKLRR